MRRESFTCSISRWTISGVMTICIGSYTFICRGVPAGFLVAQIGLEDRLVFGNERGRGRPLVAAGSSPHAPEVRILALVEGPGGRDCGGERRHERDCTERATKAHGRPPMIGR